MSRAKNRRTNRKIRLLHGIRKAAAGMAVSGFFLIFIVAAMVPREPLLILLWEMVAVLMTVTGRFLERYFYLQERELRERAFRRTGRRETGHEKTA